MIPVILPVIKSYEEGYLWSDRRSGFDRRKPRNEDSLPEQRSGKDRRRPESVEIIEYRRARTKLREQLQAYQSSRIFKRPMPGIMVVTLLGLLGGMILLFLSTGHSMANCDDRPEPGVNWSNCLLLGKELAGADLTGANLYHSSLRGANLHKVLLKSAVLAHANLTATDLSGANLSNAILRGANLRGANLSHARLNGADLSYANLADANLEGASLDGAKLDYAVWPDKSECDPGSIRICR